jgi:hypothetical protein
VALIVLLSNDLRVLRRPLPAREPEPLQLTFLDSLVRPEPPAQPPSPELAVPSDVTVPLPQIDTGPSGTAISPPVSDSVPRIDWVGERRREVAIVAEREAANAVRPKIGQHPKGIDLPRDPPPDRAGLVEHATGGEIIEWVNDHCYLTNRKSIPNYIGWGITTCKRRARKEIRVDRPPPDHDE